MKKVFFACFVLVLMTGCKKDKAARIDIYLLKSFSASVMQSSPHSTVINDAVLQDQPLVVNEDLEYFTASNTTFKLKKDIAAIIKNFSNDKAFAVTVDNQPVYYGIFHPGYLSSISMNIAIIDPILNLNNELKIDFVS